MTSHPTATEKRPVTTERPDSTKWPSFRLSHLMGLVLGCGVACWLLVQAYFVLGPIVLVLIALACGISTIASFVIVFRGLSAQRDALVQALAIAARRRMPLSPTLEVFSEQCGIVFRNRIRTLADALKSGLSLSEALDRVPGVLPRDAEVIIRVGWEAGIPVESLEEAANRRSRPPLWVNLAGRIAYLLSVLIIMQVLAGFIMYFIAPKFEAIFQDFGLALPPATLAVLQGGAFATQYSVVAGLALAAEACILVAIPLVSSGWLPVSIPFADRLLLRRHSAVILRALARVVECEKPLPQSVAMLARRYPSSWVRDRLCGVALDLDRGRDWCESFYYHGIISATDAALLDAARRAGNLPWALREAADTGERRLAYRLQAAIQLIVPILLLMLGGLVLAIATAYFSPLIVLIQRLSG